MKHYFKKKPKLFLYIAALLIFLFLFFLMQMKNESKIIKSHLKESSLDTFIPKGFVLVPIEIQNDQSLNSALGPYGVVDLYAKKSLNSSFYRRVAKGVQILKSPYEPHEFAVMLPEDKVHLILEVKGGFKVAIQNPKVNQTNFETVSKKNKKKKRKIYIEF